MEQQRSSRESEKLADQLGEWLKVQNPVSVHMFCLNELSCHERAHTHTHTSIQDQALYINALASSRTLVKFIYKWLSVRLG